MTWTEKLWIVAGLVVLLNLPFGYWRGQVKRFSRPWFLAIHLPVPGVIALRIFGGLGWSFWSFPVLVGSFFVGQLAGGLVGSRIKIEKLESDGGK